MDLLPFVASHAPHITLRAEGATANVAAGAALRLLRTGGALPDAHGATRTIEGVTFTIEPCELDLVGLVATSAPL